MARSAKRAPAAKQTKAMRPVLLAAGLGLYWFVAYQDGGNDAGAPMWGYLTMGALRLLADFVGAWLIISGLQLAIALVKIGLTYLRALWLQEG
jgi:hypothetical protein